MPDSDVVFLGAARAGRLGFDPGNYDKVVELERLPETVLSQLHNDTGDLSEVAYRLAWARSYLKKIGLLENSKRGVWSLTAQAKDLKKVNSLDGVKTAEPLAPGEIPKELLQEEAQEDAWKLRLNSILTNLAPAAFERLTQRMLRELGFTQVDVTGRSGDGGIDATRDGAPPIDLIDGEQFAEQLKELGLGVGKELIEVIDVDETWFQGI
jgi:restriction system protein